MLSTERVAIPAPIEVRLKRSSDFVDNIMDFARDDLIGFRRPLAATFALTAPILCVLSYQSGGFVRLIEVAPVFCFLAFASLWLVGRNAWPSLVQEFEDRTLEKRRAAADLKCGFTEASFLKLSRSPRFFEYDNGVLVFADAGNFKTLFFSIDKGGDDDRWAIYEAGDFQRRIWRWMRLPVSREIVKFSTEATKLPDPGPVRTIRSVDAWEAINVALGEPLDGAIIHRPFDEVIDLVERTA